MAREHRSTMYRGKLLRIHGFVNEVEYFSDAYIVRVRESQEYPSSWSVTAWMQSDQADNVRPLRKGDQITITGTIESISNHVRLEKCYIDHSTTIPHPKNLIEPLDETNLPAWFVAALARSLTQIDGEEASVRSRRLLDVLDKEVHEISEKVSYLKGTKPRGEELRFMYTLLVRWCENLPTFPRPQ